jgi:hypothetical protein
MNSGVEVSDGNMNVIERLKSQLPDVTINELKVWCIENAIMFPEHY